MGELDKPVVLNKQGTVKEILSIGSDITERIHAEDELKKYREHLEQLCRNALPIFGKASWPC